MNSVVPEAENIVYHILTMDWYTRWQQYVEDEGQQSETSMRSKDEEVKRNSKKDRHPGPLNT